MPDPIAPAAPPPGAPQPPETHPDTVTAYQKDGTPIALAPAEAAAAFKAGSVGFAGEEPVHVRLPDGRIGSVPGGALAGALGTGATLISPAEARAHQLEQEYGGTVGVGGQLLVTTATSGVESITGGLNTAFVNATSSINGLKVWFRARVLLDATVANPNYEIGLTTATATFNGNTDGVYFTKPTATANWNFVIKGAGTATTVALPTNGTGIPTGSTWIDLGYYFDGKGMFYIYFNNICIGTYGANNSGMVGSLGSSLVNLPLATVLLGPTFLNGFNTATSLLTVDFVYAACEIAR